MPFLRLCCKTWEGRINPVAKSQTMQLPKIWCMNLTCSLTASFLTFSICLCIMFIISYPFIVRQCRVERAKSIPGLTVWALDRLVRQCYWDTSVSLSLFWQLVARSWRSAITPLTLPGSILSRYWVIASRTISLRPPVGNLLDLLRQSWRNFAPTICDSAIPADTAISLFQG